MNKISLIACCTFFLQAASPNLEPVINVLLEKKTTSHVEDTARINRICIALFNKKPGDNAYAQAYQMGCRVANTSDTYDRNWHICLHILQHLKGIEIREQRIAQLEHELKQLHAKQLHKIHAFGAHKKLTDDPHAQAEGVPYLKNSSK